MSDYDIHSCGYYCDRHACIVAQRNELRDKLFSEPSLKGDDFERAFYRDWEAGKVKRVFESEPMIDGWPLYSGLPQPEPEPIAYINVEERKLEWATPIGWNTPTVVKMDKVPLYAAPLKKEWVGLTDEELLDLADMAYANDLELLQTLQAKLKEKNNG